MEDIIVKSMAGVHGVHVYGRIVSELIFNERENAEAVATIMRTDVDHKIEKFLGTVVDRREISKHREVYRNRDELYYGMMYEGGVQGGGEAVEFRKAPWTYEEVLRMEDQLEALRKEISFLKNR
ncbi:hypothetical protein [Listeria booriae]|uniref:Uncharacterized protein n=1 Tax=Listeria booriae TaxID=1552123 RepID=A0A7X0XTX9_9LIST|nr:hypothetical protein [Listeria booriae]MBC1780557.1 hypothetical protein [Listeria booriae]